MTAFQSGIAKFEGMDTQVVAISTDALPTLRHWAGELNTSFPLASDHMRTVAAAYGVLIAEAGMANRSTFVVDKEGRIQHIEEGSSAVDPSGAATACSRLQHKSQ